MKLRWMIILILALSFGCDKNKTTDVELNLEECVITEEQAKVPAMQFTTRNNSVWGELGNSSYSEFYYCFQFETEEKELGVLSPRMIWVDCRTGETGFVMRD